MLLVQLHVPFCKLPSLRTDCILQTTSDNANLKSHKPRSLRSVVIHHVLSKRNKLNKAHAMERERECTELKNKRKLYENETGEEKWQSIGRSHLGSEDFAYVSNSAEPTRTRGGGSPWRHRHIASSGCDLNPVWLLTRSHDCAWAGDSRQDSRK